jgi:mono/diheme cytochrome c family protein
MMGRLGLFALVAAALAIAACAPSGASVVRQGPSQPVQEITLTLSNYALNPAEVVVKAHTPVRLQVTSLDRDYLLGVPELAVAQAHIPGKGTVSLAFTPSVQGRYALQGLAPGVAGSDFQGILSVVACSPEMRNLANPVPLSAATLAAGRELFLQYCAACHGQGGKGDGPKARGLAARPADLTNPALAGVTEGEVFWVIRDGLGEMPSYRSILSEADRWRLVHYVRSLYNPMLGNP